MTNSKAKPKDQPTEARESVKCHLYIDNHDDSLHFSGDITEQQVADFLSALSKHDTIPESCCFGSITGHFQKYVEGLVTVESKKSDKVSHAVSPMLLKVLFDKFDSKKCKCRKNSCIPSIKNGKCKDETICNTIGKILFKKAYSK